MLPTAALSGPSLSRTHEQHASASSCCCTRRRQALINIPLIAKNTENKATRLMLSRANTHGPVGRPRPTCFQIGHQGRHGQVGQDTLVQMEGLNPPAFVSVQLHMGAEIRMSRSIRMCLPRGSEGPQPAFIWSLPIVILLYRVSALTTPPTPTTVS